jgi:hypothetical protein
MIKWCKAFIPHFRIIFTSYESMIFEASCDPLKGKSWHDTERHKYEQVTHTVKHIQVTGTEMVCKRNGNLFRDGLFLINVRTYSSLILPEVPCLATPWRNWDSSLRRSKLC